VEFLDSMMSLERPSENLGETQGATYIVTANSGKYLKQMSRSTLTRVEAIAGLTLEDLGYTLSLAPQAPARLAATQLLVAQMRDGLNLLWHGRRRRSLLDTLRIHVRFHRTTRG
jgi:hypothetical protein